MNYIKYYYYCLNKKPFGIGYGDFKMHKIKQLFNNNSHGVQTVLSNSEFLGLDERIIEYLWILSQLPKDDCKLLDAGSTLNFSFILSHRLIKNKQIFISNLSPEKNCFFDSKISYIYEDFTESCFKSNYFDVITCISVLEHVGMNNLMFYSSNKMDIKLNNNAYLSAVSELYRILKLGGVLLLTIPYGKFANHEWLQVFNKGMVEKIIKTFNPDSFLIDYFLYTDKGWLQADESQCRNSIYIDRHLQGNKNHPGAVAAESVACIKLIK